MIFLKLLYTNKNKRLDMVSNLYRVSIIVINYYSYKMTTDSKQPNLPILFIVAVCTAHALTFLWRKRQSLILYFSSSSSYCYFYKTALLPLSKLSQHSWETVADKYLFRIKTHQIFLRISQQNMRRFIFDNNIALILYYILYNTKIREREWDRERCNIIYHHHHHFILL